MGKRYIGNWSVFIKIESVKLKMVENLVNNILICLKQLNLWDFHELFNHQVSRISIILSVIKFHELKKDLFMAIDHSFAIPIHAILPASLFS